ncbi:hypothetical protein [Patulibacter sp. SYSU D01012]|uniref:hypothetical protein n=1 Tax=Patulibacter sp. SYSU D01012 TaxID=2817381 RepID=UPI001B300509|nr:hypothetical protein [Patulibacter sp. SYSU D01012]
MTLLQIPAAPVAIVDRPAATASARAAGTAWRAPLSRAVAVADLDALGAAALAVRGYALPR